MKMKLLSVFGFVAASSRVWLEIGVRETLRKTTPPPRRKQRMPKQRASAQQNWSTVTPLCPELDPNLRIGASEGRSPFEGDRVIGLNAIVQRSLGYDPGV
ncbi:MAG: hypothetical protein U5J99_06425 [Parvularculaceae bacterium]|nr:hypothetical protein [Parvularculaceae bacterium]